MILKAETKAVYSDLSSVALTPPAHLPFLLRHTGNSSAVYPDGGVGDEDNSFIQ